MSDCSSSAMEPRTCGTCGHVRETRLNCFYAANDRAYYAGCTSPDAMACEHYFDDQDSLPRRYERLAQVALDMLRYARIRLGEHWTEEDAKACKAYEDELRALGVSVDD
ncbi:MAG: hypothetical protein DBY20_03770 [Coriobacteriia bacterium]|nr:MAG: hypothetical protein DBY20_03770 [Coriobacteriia bacterium]